MISMQQLEELENRVVKALQLINDLRAENSKLEHENDNLKTDLEETKLSLEEKEQEIEKIRKELDDATRELEELNAKEEVLEKKVIALLGKLDTLSGGVGVPAGEKSERRSFQTAAPASLKPKTKRAGMQDDDTIVIDEPVSALKEEDVRIETVDANDTVGIDDDEDIIIIDDEEDLKTKAGSGVALETVSESDDDIILLDEGDEEIVIDDVDKDTIIIDEEEAAPRDRGKAKVKAVGKSRKEDDEFLIIEDDK